MTSVCLSAVFVVTPTDCFGTVPLCFLATSCVFLCLFDCFPLFDSLIPSGFLVSSVVSFIVLDRKSYLCIDLNFFSCIHADSTESHVPTGTTGPSETGPSSERRLDCWLNTALASTELHLLPSFQGPAPPGHPTKTVVDRDPGPARCSGLAPGQDEKSRHSSSLIAATVRLNRNSATAATLGVCNTHFEYRTVAAR